MDFTVNTLTAAQPSAKIVTIHTRSQHSNGSSAHQFGGPDTYVAVTVAPAGAIIPKILRSDLLAARGIEIIYCGEGYARYSGLRSKLGRALAQAQRIAASRQ
jgi:hypothetical protein